MAKVRPVFTSQLEIKTQELLRKAPRQLTHKKIAQDTGLTSNWLYHFSTGALKHPSVGRVEALYNYLSKKPLTF